jgi:hypothetical protein
LKLFLIKKFKTLNYIFKRKVHAKRNEKGLDTKKFNRCVIKVKKKSGKQANPYAVCNSTMSGKSKGKSRNSIKSKSKK